MTATAALRPADLARIEKGRSTRARLLAVARDVLRVNGIEGTSLQSVARAAGSSIGAIQLHFGSKNGLLLAVYAQHVEEERDRINAVLRSLVHETDRPRALVERLWEGNAQERVTFQLALELKAIDDAELSAQVVGLLNQHRIAPDALAAAFGADDAELQASLNAVIAALAGLASMRHLIPAPAVEGALLRIVVMARAVLEGRS